MLVAVEPPLAVSILRTRCGKAAALAQRASAREEQDEIGMVCTIILQRCGW